MTLSNGIVSIPIAFLALSIALPSITIPSSVTSIGDAAFIQCNSLDYIACLAMAAPTLGALVFVGVLTTEIHVPNGATGYGATFGGLTVVDDL
jgi:hypothetical protein